MPKSKKTNPRYKPATQADVARAKKKATDDALRNALLIMLYVLKDKLAFSDDQMSRTMMYFNRAVEELNEGRIKWHEIAGVLKDDYNYGLEWIGEEKQ